MITADKVKFDYQKTKHAYWSLKILTMPVPKRIMEILQYHYPGGRNVTQLLIALRIEQPVVSQHLMWLRKYRLVTCIRSGKNMIYKVDHDRICQIGQALDRFNGRDKAMPMQWETTVV